MTTSLIAETLIAETASALATDFADFFREIGYTVGIEGRVETRERWYEIFDDGRLVFQISRPPPPLAELIADLPHLAEGRSGVGPTNYWLACKDGSKLRDLIRRVETRQGEG